MKPERPEKSWGGLNTILAQLRRPVITDRAEELRLITLAKNGDEESMRHLLGANCGFVIQIARRYLRSGLEIEDLFLLGLAGLHKGVMRFEAKEGTRLTTYAQWWIRSTIQRGVSGGGRTVYVPDRILKLVRKASKIERSLGGTMRDEPSTADVAAELGISPKKLEYVRAVGAMSTVPFDAPVFEDGDNTIGDMYVPPDAEPSDALSLLLQHVDAEQLHRAIRTRLTPIERAVIRETFFNEKTLKDTGIAIAPFTAAKKPVSRERARQLQERALKKLAEALAPTDPDST